MSRANLRRRIEDIVERGIEMLDQLDGDPDFELETDADINPVSFHSSSRRPPKRITMRRAAA